MYILKFRAISDSDFSSLSDDFQSSPTSLLSVIHQHYHLLTSSQQPTFLMTVSHQHALSPPSLIYVSHQHYHPLTSSQQHYHLLTSSQHICWLPVSNLPLWWLSVINIITCWLQVSNIITRWLQVSTSADFQSATYLSDDCQSASLSHIMSVIADFELASHLSDVVIITCWLPVSNLHVLLWVSPRLSPADFRYIVLSLCIDLFVIILEKYSAETDCLQSILQNMSSSDGDLKARMTVP